MDKLRPLVGWLVIVQVRSVVRFSLLPTTIGVVDVVLPFYDLLEFGPNGTDFHRGLEDDEGLAVIQVERGRDEVNFVFEGHVADGSAVQHLSDFIQLCLAFGRTHETFEVSHIAYISHGCFPS